MVTIAVLPRGPVGRLDDRDPTGAEEPPNLDVQVREAHRMTRRQEHPLAATNRVREPFADGRAGVQDELRIDRDRSGRRRAFGLEARGAPDEIEDLVGVEALEAGHPELLVRVALVQEPDVAQDVVERDG